MNKNKKYTDKIMLSLFERNGNAFYLASTYATFSTVWTYTQDSIEIYRLAKGKVAEHLVSKENGVGEYDLPSMEELDKDIKECGYELDGDVFGFMIKKNLIKRHDFPVSIECLTSKSHQSRFLNEIVKSINRYKLWDIRYL
ncbi:hypothetical protein [Parapedobacter tibetensis]|uniref:hypothetical protein n=1 Tax=Parapedobacter tibetensis TaxID=2972951 RepID=UPI00214DCDDB|nr:hypothetical protein [Parapedobacter tibetensis]